MTTQVWSLQSFTLLYSRQFANKKGITALQYTPSGHLLAVGFEDGTVTLLTEDEMTGAMSDVTVRAQFGTRSHSLTQH